MPCLADVWEMLRALEPAAPPFVVGVTGAVAVGKSTFAAALRRLESADPRGPVEIVCTDGFLLANAELEARGLALRKGFPESFDQAALAAALIAVRAGAAVFPGYSHTTYDVDPSLARRVEAPAVLIVEGLCLAGSRSGPAPLLDALVYLDADEACLEGWFVDRFAAFWRAGGADPRSFYARFSHLDEAGALAFASEVWRQINLPNLRRHIRLARAQADIIVEKGPDHAFIAVRPGGAR